MHCVYCGKNLRHQHGESRLCAECIGILDAGYGSPPKPKRPYYRKDMQTPFGVNEFLNEIYKAADAYGVQPTEILQKRWGSQGNSSATLAARVRLWSAMRAHKMSCRAVSEWCLHDRTTICRATKADIQDVPAKVLVAA